MKGTYDKNVASTLVSLDVLWSALDILWSIFGVRLDDLGVPPINSRCTLQGLRFFMQGFHKAEYKQP
jgi:hypothetical protein